MVDVVATLQHAIEVVVLADLSADLADAKLELANLKVEMATFTSENLDLKTQLSAKIVAKAKLDKGAYAFPSCLRLSGNLALGNAPHVRQSCDEL